MMKTFLLLTFLMGCSSNAFRKPTPLPPSAEAFCRPHFDLAYKQAPKSVPLNKSRYNFDALMKGLSDASRVCYQGYIEKNLDRHQGKIACMTYTIDSNGIDNIQFADVGIFNPPVSLKDCVAKFLKASKSNIKGKDQVFVEQSMMFFTKAMP